MAVTETLKKQRYRACRFYNLNKIARYDHGAFLRLTSLLLLKISSSYNQSRPLVMYCLGQKGLGFVSLFKSLLRFQKSILSAFFGVFWRFKGLNTIFTTRR